MHRTIFDRRQRWRLPVHVPILLVLLATLSRFTKSSQAQPSCPAFEGYDTVAGQDADLGDMGRVAGGASEARAACEAVPNCVGFNSRGWLKVTLANWKNDSAVCTYVRRGGAASAACRSFPGFDARPGQDADGNDIWQPADWDPDAAFTACDNNPWCKGFNNKGYVKHTLANWKADRLLCTYVRHDVWMKEGESGAGQIGTGADRRKCVTIDPSDAGKGYMWDCAPHKDSWGQYGQHFGISRVKNAADPPTVYYAVYRLTMEPPLYPTSYYYAGGCLTRSTGGVVYTVPCRATNHPDTGFVNQDAWDQQWDITPANVGGLSGFRISARMSTRACLQMGDPDDDNNRLYVRGCDRDDKRQIFAISFS